MINLQNCFKFHFSLYTSTNEFKITKRKMAAPALKDLPKVAVDLKSQLEGFSTNKLKNTDTQEKIILPTAEGKLFWILIVLVPIFS